jgi:hypothetical protein
MMPCQAQTGGQLHTLPARTTVKTALARSRATQSLLSLGLANLFKPGAVSPHEAAKGEIAPWPFFFFTFSPSL